MFEEKAFSNFLFASPQQLVRATVSIPFAICTDSMVAPVVARSLCFREGQQ
jgi:hypothetical protein